MSERVTVHSLRSRAIVFDPEIPRDGLYAAPASVYNLDPRVAIVVMPDGRTLDGLTVAQAIRAVECPHPTMRDLFPVKP